MGRRIDPKELYAQQIRDQYFVPSVAFQKPMKIDAMRISLQVQKNKQKDENSYNNVGKAIDDVLLKNKDD